MWQKVTGYIGAIHGDQLGDAVKFTYSIGFDYGIGQHLSFVTQHAAEFAAWMSASATDRAEYDSEQGTIRATG
jgi:hypothetical protein